MNKKRVKLAIWNGAGNDEQSTKSLSRGLLTVIVDVVVMFIFVWAARMILKDVFGVRGMTFGEVMGCIAVTGLISGVMELIDARVTRRKGLFKICVLPVSIGAILLYVWIFKDYDKIIGGFVNFASKYLTKWSIYYNTSVGINSIKDGNIRQAVAFAVILLVVILVWIGKCIKARIHFVIMAVVGIVLPVMVGYAPGVTPCVMTLVGVLLANVLEYENADFILSVRDRAKELFHKKYIYIASVAFGIIIGSVGVKALVSPSVNDSLKYSVDVKKLQKNILEDFSLSEFLKELGEILWDKNKGGEIISNMKLTFKDEVDLKMYTDKKPKDKIYLKGFYGSEYRDGRWLNDAEEFEEAVEREKQLDLTYVKDAISYKNVMAVYSHIRVESYDPYGLATKLEYKKKGSTVAYIPYFTSSMGGISELKGDVYYTKPKKQKNIEFITYQEDIDYKYYDGNAAADYIEEWEYWYEEYVCSNYLGVPKDMKCIKKLAGELKSLGLEGLSGQPGENRLRVEAAEQVINWFANNVTYTVDPPTLPRNADPIEYFITKSKKGYCMHYASAATLILREMGVPARYASGYYVSTSDFEATTDGYVGTIMDNASHAWVEIYLDKIGWVPIEVTTSYIDGVNPHRDYDEDVDVNVETKPSDTEDDSDDKEETSSEAITTKPTTDSKETTSANVEKESSTGGAGYYGTNNDAVKKSVLLRVAIFVAIALIIPLIIYIFARIRRRKEEKLQIMMNKGRTNRAIKEINRRIYVKLKKKGKLIGVKSSDMAYKEVLIKTYPFVSAEEWDKYMDIVREMAFSKNDGTKEDMEYCYEIYMRVKKQVKEIKK